MESSASEYTCIEKYLWHKYSKVSFFDHGTRWKRNPPSITKWQFFVFKSLSLCENRVQLSVLWKHDDDHGFSVPSYAFSGPSLNFHKWAKCLKTWQIGKSHLFWASIINFFPSALKVKNTKFWPKNPFTTYHSSTKFFHFVLATSLVAAYYSIRDINHQ